MTQPDFNVCVHGPSTYLTITIEMREEAASPDIHLHPGGQGFWIARMIGHLGGRPVLVSPIGGETGAVVRMLAPTWDVDLRAVETDSPSPSYVHDRRHGERREIASSTRQSFDRHELDDYYGLLLECAVMAGICVVTGKAAGDTVPLDWFRRLGSDLASTDVAVVGDLHGEELAAFLDGGPIQVLKVSDDNLHADGLLAECADVEARLGAIDEVRARGVENVVLSSAGGTTVAHLQGRGWAVDQPTLDAVDHRGSGDSMTAALAVARLRGLDASETLRLACGAGAANVTRHGLGNVKADLVDALGDTIAVRSL